LSNSSDWERLSGIGPDPIKQPENAIRAPPSKIITSAHRYCSVDTPKDKRGECKSSNAIAAMVLCHRLIFEFLPFAGTLAFGFCRFTGC
jgi:hypothetical protein